MTTKRTADKCGGLSWGFVDWSTHRLFLKALGLQLSHFLDHQSIFLCQLWLTCGPFENTLAV